MSIELLEKRINEKIEVAGKLRKNMRNTEDVNLLISMEQEIDTLIDTLVDLKEAQHMCVRFE